MSAPSPPSPTAQAGWAIDLPEIVAEVSAQYDRYEAALMADDEAVMNELFRAAPETLRYGVGECLYGHAAIAAYRAGRPRTPLARTITRKVVTTYGSDVATVNIEYRRHSLPDRIGRQSQTWLRCPEGWRIVAAHVSFMERPGWDLHTLQPPSAPPGPG